MGDGSGKIGEFMDVKIIRPSVGFVERLQLTCYVETLQCNVDMPHSPVETLQCNVSTHATNAEAHELEEEISNNIATLLL